MCDLDKIIFKHKHHDIAVCEDMREFIRACRRRRAAILYAPDMPLESLHAEIGKRLTYRPMRSHDASGYPGNREICSPSGHEPKSLAGKLAEHQNGHTDGSAEKEWLMDFVISYLKADALCGGELELCSAADVLNTLSGSETQLLLNMTVEIERNEGWRPSRYEGPLLRVDGRTWAFRWRFDSVAKAQCIDLDPLMRRDAEQLIRYVAAQIEALPKTAIRPQPGVIVYVTQAGEPDDCLVHGRTAKTAPQIRIAKRQWLNRLH